MASGEKRGREKGEGVALRAEGGYFQAMYSKQKTEDNALAITQYSII